MKRNYLIIPSITILTALLGGWATSGGLEGWYSGLRLPSWTPPGTTIGIVWTILYILATISALIIFNKRTEKKKRIKMIMSFFAVNAVLNVTWSLLFFNLHLINMAVYEAALLGISVVIISALCWQISRAASLLLVPYAAWVAFATYLTYIVSSLN